MGRLAEIINKLDSITPDVIDEGLLNIVKKNQAEAVSMNVSQLFSGRDSLDQPLGFYKNQRYAALKNYNNPAPGYGIMDWKLTGALYSGWYANADQFPVTFGSTDEKFQMLDEQNPDGKGLDQNNLETFRQDIKPQIQELFRSLIKL